MESAPKEVGPIATDLFEKARVLQPSKQLAKSRGDEGLTQEA
jgi:hypothetical protein